MKVRFANWHALRRLFHYARDTLRQQRWVIGGSFTALLLETGFRLVEPWPLQYVIDNLLFVPGVSGQTLGEVPVIALVVVAVTLVSIIGLRAFAAYGWTVGFALAGNRVLLALRAKVFDHLQLLSLRFHGASRDGDLLTRLVDDVGMVRDVVVTALMPLFGNLFLLVAMLTVMAWLNWRLTLVAILGTPLLFLLSKSKTKTIHRAAKEQRRQVSRIAATASEALSGIHAVQALGLGHNMAVQFQTANDADLRSGVKVKRLSAGMERSVDVVVGMISAAVLAAGVLEVQAGRLSTGELLVFLAYLRSTAKPVRNWAKFTARIAKSSAGAERILEILDEAPSVVEAADARVLTTTEGGIEFRNITFAYEAGHNVLQDANLIIHPGETVALVGESGVGKSTLLALVMRLHDPDSGQIFLDGHNLKSLTIRSLREQFSIALQDPLLFHGSVRDNIAQGLNDVSPDAVEVAANQALVTRFTDQWPDGLDTQIGERGAKLSNGQKQRISLARALIKNAPIIIVDEPLTGLDSETAKAIDNALREFSTSRTFILVTHDNQQAARADRVINIRGRKLVEVTRCGQRSALARLASPDAEGA